MGRKPNPNKLTKVEFVALELLKVELLNPKHSAEYISNFAAEDCMHQAKQLIRAFNGQSPLLDQVAVYTKPSKDAYNEEE